MKIKDIGRIFLLSDVHLIRIKYRFLLIMLKIFSRQVLSRLCSPLRHNNLHFNFTNAVKILRE
jgi:hypothetical protein